jgi:hypothetical protein
MGPFRLCCGEIFLIQRQANPKYLSFHIYTVGSELNVLLENLWTEAGTRQRYGVNMNDMKKPPGSELLEIAVPEDVERQLVNWIREVAVSNNELVDALNRLRLSYKVLLAGEPVTDAQEILRQVENALRSADKAKDMA